MAITFKDFNALVSDQVASLQAGTRLLLDYTVGSVIRSIVEANASIVLWVQALLANLLQSMRASTAVAADLDSWMADYGVTRLAAVAATGQATFSRFTTTQQSVVPAGTTVQTADGSQKFTVTLDTTNGAYSAGLGGYVLAIGASSVSVPVQANTAGVLANIVIGGISSIAGSIVGVDTVSNAAAFTNGANAETDTALRVRFVAYVASLSKATKTAVGYAITSLKTGLSFALVENLTYAGAVSNGYFYVVVDDGTGVPGSTLLTSVANAIDSARPLTSTFGVFAPVVINASVAMTATIAAGYDPVATKALAVTALKSYINLLPLGQSLTYSRLAQVAYDASPGITNLTSITLNGATADLVSTSQQVIKWSSVGVA
ncbi:MAG: baseplate protein [Rhodoferax sp.]|uniref:baseplate J/gp47 family protein n=1 Tax=Rhodoferax sp. TaxID=50421 RepID=UPI00182FD62F|nr:baseplate J/gp47 family protein [Rhodoferax sp.]NMM21852.1 baseplate protein [Rhodoferax sp.]